MTNVRKENDILKFISECSILLDIDVEESKIYKRFLITKKKHYIDIYEDCNKEPNIKGMEGIRGDRPPWINKVQKQFANDIKNGNDRIVNIRKEYDAIESGQVSLEELEIKLTLAKKPEEYPENRLQRLIGSELDANQGDTIKYYKSNTLGGGTSNSNLISWRKYLEMLRTIFDDSLKVMGFDFNRDILGQKIL